MVTRYVNTASTAGGNGTTNATSGANRAYASLAEWETAEQADLTGTGVHEVLCCGTTADTSRVTVDGWTTTASDYIHIRGNPGDPAGRHPGYWSTSHYRLEVSTTDNDGVLGLRDPHIKVTGIQINATADKSTGNVRGINMQGGASWVDSCIVRSTGGGTGLLDDAGIRFHNGATAIYLTNNVVVGFGSGITGNNWTGTISGAIYNNTCANCDRANFWIQNGNAALNDIHLKNNLSVGSPASGGFVLENMESTATNASTDTSSPETGLRSVSPSFVDSAAIDYRLSASDTAVKDLGTDLSADSIFAFDTDIEGLTRTAPWDIGADHLIVGIEEELSPLTGALTFSVRVPELYYLLEPLTATLAVSRNTPMAIPGELVLQPAGTTLTVSRSSFDVLVHGRISINLLPMGYEGRYSGGEEPFLSGDFEQGNLSLRPQARERTNRLWAPHPSIEYANSSLLEPADPAVPLDEDWTYTPLLKANGSADQQVVLEWTLKPAAGTLAKTTGVAAPSLTLGLFIPSLLRPPRAQPRFIGGLPTGPQDFNQPHLHPQTGAVTVIGGLPPSLWFDGFIVSPLNKVYRIRTEAPRFGPHIPMEGPPAAQLGFTGHAPEVSRRWAWVPVNIQQPTAWAEENIGGG